MRSRWRRLVLLILSLAPSTAVCQADEIGVNSHLAEDGPSLCLAQVGEWPLPGEFEFVGLSTSDDVGAGSAITVWSRSALVVVRLSPEAVVETVVRVPVVDVSVLAAALVDWSETGPIVELFDARDGTIWTLDAATGEIIAAAASTDPVKASGAIKHGSDWVWVEEVLNPMSDTTRILVSAGRQAEVGSGLSTIETPGEPERRIDRLVHLRSDGSGGYLVQEAGFPFSTIRFTRHGEEAWQTQPEPDDLRHHLGETDLRYVMSTPAVAVDNATLTTFVALRSRQRASALTLERGTSVRYKAIPGDVAFLSALPAFRLLIGTRGIASRSLVFLEWHWTDQRQGCT